MSKVMIFRKKNIPFQKTPVILIQKNKSVIGNGDGGGGYVWNPSLTTLYRMKKDNEYFYPAPWYAYFKSGKLVQKLNFAEMQFTEFINGITVYEEKGIEVLPYLPKTSDNYYRGNTEELTFIANKDFDMRELCYKYNGKEWVDVDYVIGSYKKGENINSVNCNLLKLKYDLYVTKKDGTDEYTEEELFAIYNKIYAKVKCTGKPELSQASTGIQGGGDCITGFFSASPITYFEYDMPFYSSMLNNSNYIRVYDDNHVGDALCGLPRQIVTDNLWNGEQKVNDITVNPLLSYLCEYYDGYHTDSRVGGFYAEHAYDIDPISVYSDLYNARFKTWYILREVDTWKGPITG